MSDDIGADLYGQAAAGSSSRDGITTEAKRGKVVIGYRKAVADTRLVRHDRLAARTKPPIHWEVTMDSQMPAIEAGDTLLCLHEIFHLVGASPEVHEGFLNAVLFAHTLNSASVLQPGRAKFSLGDNIHYLDWAKVVEYLGNNQRRFFRAFANETREVNLRVLLDAKDPDDIVAQEKANWLRNAAANRGMSRHPDLTHDSADACWNLTDGELAALNASKMMVFSTQPNMADRNRFRPVQSLNPGVGSMYEDPTARAHALADVK
jgi:hypothetical protein